MVKAPKLKVPKPPKVAQIKFKAPKVSIPSVKPLKAPRYPSIKQAKGMSTDKLGKALGLPKPPSY